MIDALDMFNTEITQLYGTVSDNKIMYLKK